MKTSRRSIIERMRIEDNFEDLEDIKAFTNSKDLRINNRNRQTEKRVKKLDIKTKVNNEPV